MRKQAKNSRKHEDRSQAASSGRLTDFELQIASQAITSLKPYERNARTHSKRQIKKIAHSIEKFGFNNPVLVNSDGRIIAGHGRVEAAKLLGLEKIPTIRIDHLTESQIRAYVLADNRLAELSGWDKEILRIELQHLVAVDTDIDVTITGFETPEVDLLLGADDSAAEEDVSDAPDLPRHPVTRAGDLWIIGPHRILCGDARSNEDVRRLLGGRQIQLTVSDPPFNVRVAGHITGKGCHREFAMASGEMTAKQFVEFLSIVTQRMVDVMVDGALAYLFIDWRHLPEMLASAGSVFGPMHNLCVWVKTNAGMGSHYRSQHELVCVFKNGKAPHINNVDLGRFGRYRSNVWIRPGANTFRKGRDQDLADHPTVKPTSLIADILLDSSRPHDIVLDSFLGSGTTLLACARTGRIGYGIEIDPCFCDVALRRLQEATALIPRLEETNETFEEAVLRRTARKAKGSQS